MLNSKLSRSISSPDDYIQIQNHRCWVDFNRTLNEDVLSLTNEASIERRLKQLLAMEIKDGRLFWLSFARVAEMALNQAGDYADNCEFQAAGDLLVNPRRIDIHRKGWADPVVKNRHGALSVQFETAIGGDNPVVWLSRETCPQIRTEALLPSLEKMLSSSGFIDPVYLTDLYERMGKVADAIAFLMAWQIEDNTQLYQRMKESVTDEAAFIESGLCNFNRHHFNAIGADIESIILQNRQSSYLTAFV